jgi:hypothetical protein
MMFNYRLPETDAEALSSMLMSWYISGFHTGNFSDTSMYKSELYILLIHYIYSIIYCTLYINI